MPRSYFLVAIIGIVAVGVSVFLLVGRQDSSDTTDSDVPNEICDFDVVIPMDEILDCTIVQGSVTVNADEVGSDFVLEDYLPSVDTIEGNLLFQGNTGSDLTSFSAGVVEVINGLIRINVFSSLETVEFSKLSFIGFDLTVTENPQLSSVSFPELDTVESYVFIVDNAALTSMTFPKLVSIDEFLWIGTNPLLPTIDCPELTSVGQAFLIEFNNVLTSVSMPKFQEVRCEVACGYLWFRNNPILPTIELPEFSSVGSYVEVVFHDALLSVSLPGLQTVGEYIRFRENPQLSVIDLPQLTSIVQFGVDIRDNIELEILNMPKIENVGNFIQLGPNGPSTVCAISDCFDLGELCSCNPCVEAISAVGDCREE